MDTRSLRIGDWICDEANGGLELRAGVNEILYASLFSPVAVRERFLAGFKVDEIGGEKIYYRNEGKMVASVKQNGDVWEVSIRGEYIKVEGTIMYVHELQHLLSDARIFWKIG